jgi:hypothetical protein
MIDTIRIKFLRPRPLRYPHQQLKERLQADDRWQYRYERFSTDTGKAWGLLASHKHSGARIGIVGDAVVMVEVSLPRLLFGYNYSLITSQEQIRTALSVMEGLLRQWALTPNETGDGYNYQFTRIDLVLQFAIPDVPASAFTQAMANMNHPSCRKKQKEWSQNGRSNAAYHEGGKMQIKTYDKLLRETNGERFGPVARVEIKLEGDPLKAALGPDVGVYPLELNFEECYQSYRAILLRFRSESCRGIRTPVVRGSARDVLLDVFAHACRVNLIMPDNRTPMDHLRSCEMSRQTLRTHMREISGRQFGAIGVTWEELLPEQWSPPHLAHSLYEHLYRFSAAARSGNAE